MKPTEGFKVQAENNCSTLGAMVSHDKPSFFKASFLPLLTATEQAKLFRGEEALVEEKRGVGERVVWGM